MGILPKLAEELGVSVDYLLVGKESVVTDTISAIKADKSLKLRTKRVLIALVEELRVVSTPESARQIDNPGKFQGRNSITREET